MQRRLSLALVLSGLLVRARWRGTSSAGLSRDIRPILSENCFQCHGFDEKARQAELRLDVADSAYAEPRRRAASVPGDLEQSELWRRITTDESEMMPPPDSHRATSAEQKEKLKRWIEQGGYYAIHWSFIPPAKAARRKFPGTPPGHGMKSTASSWRGSTPEV